MKRRNENKKIKKTVSIVALILMLAMAASLITCLPVAATTFPKPNIETTAYLYFRPNPIGVGQELLINGWVTPTPPRYQDLGWTPPPGESWSNGVVRNYTVYITEPDGTVITLEPITSDGAGTFWLTYVPDKVGTWYIQLAFAGVSMTGTPEAQVQSCSYLPCSSEKQPLIVQNDPVPSWPAAPLPTEPWTYPISYENREWITISGPWYQNRYDGSRGGYNPYSQGPASSHILWKIPPVSGVAGLIGGDYGTARYYSSSRASITTVIAGRGYYTAAGNIYCIDIRTGEQLWTAPGSFQAGAVDGGVPILLNVGTRIIKYNGLTGAVTLNMTGITGIASAGDIQFEIKPTYYCAYIQTLVGPAPPTIVPATFDGYYLVKLWLNGTTTNLSDRIAWNVSMAPLNTRFSGGSMQIDGDILYFHLFPIMTDVGAFNTTTGEILWHHPQDDPYAAEGARGSPAVGYGKAYFSIENMRYIALDLKTGSIAWISEEAEYPWGNFWGYSTCVAYDMIYDGSYAGVYAFNASNGKIVWHFKEVDNFSETPYGNWPFHTTPLAADGKLYIPSGEHTPTTPYLRGWRLYCLDAFTGKELWSILGYWSHTAIAEGILFANQVYDGCSYAFSKGPTSTTISVNNAVAAKGNSFLISGTVLDMSPAQPNTPAVSDDSMSAWMEYLHMQQPKPTNITGVPVKLTAIDQSGNSQDIGTVWSDEDGLYKKLWTPTTEGEYTIKATFEGSLSYYSSYAKTVVGVGPAAAGSSPSVTEPPTSPSTTDSPAPSTTTSASPTDSAAPTSSPSAIPGPESTTGTEVYITIAAAVIIVAVIAVALVLRRRSK